MFLYRTVLTARAWSLVCPSYVRRSIVGCHSLLPASTVKVLRVPIRYEAISILEEGLNCDDEQCNVDVEQCSGRDNTIDVTTTMNTHEIAVLNELGTDA